MIRDITLTINSTIKEALKIIDKGTMRIAIVVDTENKLMGTLNDGDIRRALLGGIKLEDSIKNIYYKTPSVCTIHDSKDTVIQTAIKNKVYQIPIVDDDYRLIDVEDLATLLTNVNKKNKVVLMAGGLGTRLQPLTNNTPKPLLKVGTKPILETIIENFASYGFKDIIISVNYKSEMIREYFKDGRDFGVNIEYVEESKRLGTAGALSLLKEYPNEPFFVMNGDLLTNVNFSHLLDFHSFGNSMATMCVREFQYQIPYGVIETSKDKISSIVEKPTQNFFVNAGIYLLSPKVLKFIPDDEFYDMPTLFNKLIGENKNVLSFPIHEYWLDIGQHNDFIQANNEYDENFR
ncbi:MAG: nucleotidyltransferase family protein [Campylobacterota bacterium]|nr:nucleotidyltransferase family protein [Campylobacterota bacterium]